MSIAPMGSMALTSTLPMMLANEQVMMRDMVMIATAESTNYGQFQKMLQNWFVAQRKVQEGWIQAFAPPAN